tara:strand:+ start:88 stop:933 length:846 start_codon:yes stop_codon:yes gene_type:complete
MKAIICSTIKNEEKNLNSFFKFLDKIIYTFEDYYIILVESDSIDDTFKKAKKKLLNYKGKVIRIKTDHLKLRTDKISLCRNAYLKLIKQDINLSNYDFMIVADADRVNKNINKVSILNSINNAPKDWAGIFANQKFIYYDIWPLRIKNYIENDCYQDFIKLSETNSTKKAYYLAVFKKFFFIKKFQDRFIKVNSAFGGFGIYRIKEILDIEYDSNSGMYSEHVLFNKKILKKQLNKSLYIDQKLINFSGLNEHILKGIIYSISNYFSKKLLEKFRNINKKI